MPGTPTRRTTVHRVEEGDHQALKDHSFERCAVV
jgi:hypothetical protein